MPSHNSVSSVKLQTSQFSLKYQAQRGSHNNTQPPRDAFATPPMRTRQRCPVQKTIYKSAKKQRRNSE